MCRKCGQTKSNLIGHWLKLVWKQPTVILCTGLGNADPKNGFRSFQKKLL